MATSTSYPSLAPIRRLALALVIGASCLWIAAGTASAATNPKAPQLEQSSSNTTTTPLSLAEETYRLRLDPALELDHPNAIGQRRRTYRRRYYRTRINYGPQYSHRTVVVVDDRPQTVVVTDPPITKRPRRRKMSLALRTVGITYGDTQLSRGNLEGHDVGGLGLGLRADLDHHWTLEIAADLLGGEQEDSQIAVIPITTSIIARLFPRSRVDLYGLAGVGLHRTAIDYQNARDENFMQLSAHAGAGAEIKFGGLLLTGDVRYMFLEARPAPARTVRATEQGLTTQDEPSNPDQRPVRDEVQDDLITALQLTFALGYRW